MKSNQFTGSRVLHPTALRNAGISLLICLSCLSAISKASAQEMSANTGTSGRLKCIETILAKDDKSNKIWWYGWLCGYSAATAGQVMVGLSADKLSLRQDMYLGAATTLIGAAGQFFTPVLPLNASARFRSLPEGTSYELERKLAIAEEIIQKRISGENEGRSWKMHAVSAAVNIGSGLVTWLAFRRTWKDGLANFALNTAITEAQIWTQPVYARKAFKKYCRGIDREPGLSTLKKPGSYCYIKAGAGNFGLCLVF